MKVHPNLSDRQKAVDWAQGLVNGRGFYVLDTETTGVGSSDEMVQLGILDHNGDVVLDTLVKPRKRIPQEVINIHGITNEDVADALTFKELYVKVSSLLAGEIVVAYNVDFDKRIIDQTCSLYGLPKIRARSWTCAMKTYASFYGQLGRRGYTWQKLSKACIQQGITLTNAHRAVDDCIMTLDLVRKMAEG